MMLEKVNEASKVTLYFLRESNSTFTMVVLGKGVFKLKPIAGIQFMLGSSGFYISPISVPPPFFCIFLPPLFFFYVSIQQNSVLYFMLFLGGLSSGFSQLL